jgi:hypothetical protein
MIYITSAACAICRSINCPSPLYHDGFHDILIRCDMKGPGLVENMFAFIDDKVKTGLLSLVMVIFKDGVSPKCLNSVDYRAVRRIELFGYCHP